MFIEPKSVSERSLSMENFREWAGDIANSFLNSGILPTDSLTKVAMAEELTPHQIGVLAGEANKEIHRHKYAAAKDKYFAADFPLADAKMAIDMLQADGGEVKISTQLPEPVVKPQELDLFKAFGVEEPAMDKRACVKSELKIASVRADHLQQKVEDKALLSKFAADAACEKFIKLARSFVLQEENPEARMKALGKLDQFVKSAGMDEGRDLLAKLSYVLGREGMITPSQTKVAFQYFVKKADVKAPQELISEWLPAQIVNGEHPLYITLKTVRDCKNDEKLHNDKHTIIQDKLNVIRQKVRAL